MIFNKKWVSGLIFIFLLISVWLTWHSTPILHIKLTSSIPGTTQIFYKKTHLGYMEKFSIQEPLKAGKQVLSFKPNKLHRVLRWDPADGSGTFLVKNIWVEVCNISFNIDLETLAPSNQIASLIITPEGLLIKTIVNINDPQIQFNVPFSAIYSIKYLSILLTIILMVLCFISFKKSMIFSNFSLCSPEKDKSIFLLLTRKLQDRHFFSLGRFAVLVMIACIFYWYFLSHFYLLIDDEYSAFRAISPGGANVWVGQGRWLSYLLEKYVLIQPIVPYVQNFVFCLSIAFSYMFIILTYRLKNRALVYFTYPLFCAFPIWAFIIAFYANIASVSVGILLVSAGIFIFDCYKDSLSQMRWTKQNLVSLCVQAIFLAMAIATYQAFILTYVVMGLGLILFNLVVVSKNEDTVRKAGFNVLYLAVITVLGLLFYFVINKVALWLIPSDTAYIKGFLDWQELFKEPGKAIHKVFLEALAYYSGSTEKYGASLNFTGILIFLSSIISFFSLWKRTSKRTFTFCIVLLGIIFLVPFAFNFISRGSLLNTRSLLAIPFVIWLVTVMALTIIKGGAKVLVFTALLILEFQMLQVTGLYAAAIEVTGNHDRAMAANLYERVGALSKDGCNDTPCFVDVYGLYHITTPYPTAWSSTMGASFFEWDGGNVNRMLSFMRLLGYTNLVALDPLHRIDNVALFEKMPVWPAAGSVVKSKDVYLIKLSNAPDPTHVKQ